MHDYGEVVARVDLVKLVEAAGGVLRRQGSEFRGRCVLHGGNSPTSFAVYRKEGKWHWKCFSRDCGTGDAIDFVMAWQGVTRPEAFRYLGGQEQIDPAKMAEAAAARQAARLAELEEQARAMLAAIEQMRKEQVWVTYWQNLDADEHARALWRARGIPDTWQTLWQLGYSPDHTVWADGKEYHSPTLTIPIFETSWKFINLKHRLLSPPTPGDRYRTHRSGVPCRLYQADPDRPIAGQVLVVEGEIKSMVTFITLDDPGVQVVGILGKNAWRDALNRFEGAERIYLLADPDAEADMRKLAAALGPDRCRIVPQLTMKVDDAINAGYLDQNGLRRLLRSSEKVI